MTKRRHGPENHRRSDAVRQLRELIRANVPAGLGGYLRNLAAASAVVAAAGCATSHIPPESELDAPLCEAGVFAAAHGLSPASEHAYIGAYSYEGFVAEAFLIDEVGVACAEASDPALCATQVADLTLNTFGRYLLTTDGEDARAHATEEELLAMLGPIDTPQEALVRAWHAGYTIHCDDLSRSGVREIEGGYEVVATRTEGGCGTPVVLTRYLLFVSSEGAVTEVASQVVERSDGSVCAGRRPEGLQPVPEAVSGDPVGAWFASVTRLEESAVEAFLGLARELEAHGAPRTLIDAAHVAADDEIRHQASMGALARRWGVAPIPAVIDAHVVRPLFEIALENAVEGCVRETFGALVGHHQARASRDAEVAAAMLEIADDETRHAQLSWAVAEWIEPKLSESEREELRIARARAVGELRAEASAAPDPRLIEIAGLPSADIAVALLDHVADTLLS